MARTLRLVSLVMGVVASLDAHDDRLKRMADRAHWFRGCLEVFSAFVQEMQDYEFFRCQDIVYVHDYKAAGTTISAVVEAICPEEVIHSSSWEEDERIDDFDDFLNKNYTFFTFVRDPIQRFQSGLFELAVRQNEWLDRMAESALSSNQTVASVAIDYLTKGNAPNPHVEPQILFLEQMGRALPISYIGLVSSSFSAELHAIAVKLFNWNGEKPAETMMNKAHERNSNDPNYSAGAIVGPFGNVRREVLDEETRKKIIDYYKVDYECLDFQ